MFRFIKKFFGKDAPAQQDDHDQDSHLVTFESDSHHTDSTAPQSNENELESSSLIQKNEGADAVLHDASAAPGGWFYRLKAGLQKTKQQIGNVFTRTVIDEDFLENLEDVLITSDVGLPATQNIMQDLRTAIKQDRLHDAPAIKAKLCQLLINILKPCQTDWVLAQHTNVVMMIGVNGAGKTTTIGKLCQYFAMHQQKVLLAAGDTFRAAAKEQLQAWGERNHVHVITGSDDPASLSFDAVQSGLAKKYDVVMIDTAGRLPTQMHLLEELKKVKRSIEKSAGAHSVLQHTLLVIDGTTGQNALQQVQVFHEAVGLDGLIITKLDGSAKGGILVAIAQKFGIPIYFIGVGEALEDLQAFQAEAFVHALFEI